MTQHTPYDLPARMTEKIRVDDNECWTWTACLSTSGYGKIYYQRFVWHAHRLAYTLLIDDIPEGLVIDHLCRNRACCNPDHLRVCTHRENILAPGAESPSARRALQTHCEHGHALTGSNVRIKPNNTRACRTCARIWARAKRRKRNAA